MHNKPCHGFKGILKHRQPREELQCSYENLMSNNFHKMAVLKKMNCKLKLIFTPKVASLQTSFGVHLSRIHFSPTERPWGRNECVTNEPQRMSAGRLLLEGLYALEDLEPIFEIFNTFVCKKSSEKLQTNIWKI